MMTSFESVNALNNIANWKVVTYFSVGGFEWLGFSQYKPNKMIIISSQKSTILNCDNGEIEECLVEYDEQELIAICEKLPNERILIVGRYGGELSKNSKHGEKVRIETNEKFITTVMFFSVCEKEYVIFQNYGFYTCGFSYDGNYFVLADDGGIIVAKRYQ